MYGTIITIGGRRWQVVPTTPDQNTKEYAGFANYETAKLHIGDHLPMWDKRATLLHELMHATLYHAGFYKHSEQLVSISAQQLFIVSNYNPQIVEMLFSADGFKADKNRRAALMIGSMKWKLDMLPTHPEPAHWYKTDLLNRTITLWGGLDEWLGRVHFLRCLLVASHMQAGYSRRHERATTALASGLISAFTYNAHLAHVIFMRGEPRE